MRNIRRSVALALAAIMMMAMNMVSFAADTAPAETEAVESVTRSTNGESVLLDKVYFACDGKNTISSREPIPATALDIENAFQHFKYALLPPLINRMLCKSCLSDAVRFCSQRVAFSPFFDNLRLVWSPL